jgi:hypothetical protein
MDRVAMVRGTDGEAVPLFVAAAARTEREVLVLEVTGVKKSTRRLFAGGRAAFLAGAVATALQYRRDTGRVGSMADQWLFKSETYDNCNCEMNCGCQFNLPSTRGYCQSAFIGHIVDGHFNDTPLVGLNWAALYRWPGEIKDGKGKRQIVIDERADEAQRSALERIVSGQAGKPLSNLFSVFASTCSESCETLFLPIDLQADLGRQGSRYRAS